MAPLAPDSPGASQKSRNHIPNDSPNDSRSPARQHDVIILSR